MKKLLRQGFLMVSIGLVACTPVPLKPGATNVIVTKHTVGNMCHYKGNLTVTNVRGSTNSFASHETLVEKEVDILRNKALQQRANVIVINNHRVTTLVKHHGKRKKIIYEHSLAGQAYHCGPHALQYIHPVTPEQLANLKQ